MTAIRKIYKKIKRKNLGRRLRQMIIKLRIKNERYNIVLSRMSARPNNVHDKMGHLSRLSYKKNTKVLCINMKKFKKYLSCGAIIHTNLLKLLGYAPGYKQKQKA